jgi:hypothetical protein
VQSTAVKQMRQKAEKLLEGVKDKDSAIIHPEKEE